MMLRVLDRESYPRHDWQTSARIRQMSSGVRDRDRHPANAGYGVKMKFAIAVRQVDKAGAQKQVTANGSDHQAEQKGNRSKNQIGEHVVSLDRVGRGNRSVRGSEHVEDKDGGKSAVRIALTGSANSCRTLACRSGGCADNFVKPVHALGQIVKAKQCLACPQSGLC